MPPLSWAMPPPASPRPARRWPGDSGLSEGAPPASPGAPSAHTWPMGVTSRCHTMFAGSRASRASLASMVTLARLQSAGGSALHDPFFIELHGALIGQTLRTAAPVLELALLSFDSTSVT